MFNTIAEATMVIGAIAFVAYHIINDPYPHDYEDGIILPMEDWTEEEVREFEKECEDDDNRRRARRISRRRHLQERLNAIFIDKERKN